MPDEAKNIKVLRQVADAALGYPFRGPVKEIPGGKVAVVQIRNADPERSIDWASLACTELPGRKEPDWLRSRDVLFVARGRRNAAVYLDEVPRPAVCAPQLYRLRAKDENILPAYLAWYLNQAPAQRYFAQSAEGTLVTSIRRAELEALPVPIPSLERQRIIARLADAVRREKLLTEELLRNRKQQLRLVAGGLIE